MSKEGPPSSEGDQPRKPWNEKILPGHPVIAAPGQTRADLWKSQPELLDDAHWVHQERLLLQEATRGHSFSLIEVLNAGVARYSRIEAQGQALSQDEQFRYRLLRAIRDDYLVDPAALSAYKN